MIHAMTPPCRASAPPWNATAGAMSERSAPVSRSCPLRAGERARAAPANAPVALDWTLGLCPSARSGGSPDDAPRADGKPHSRCNTHPPTRRTRRTRAPAHIHDTDQIDLPRAAAPARSGWTPAAIVRMLPRGSAVHAHAAKARGLDPGLHLLHPCALVVDAASGRGPAHSNSSHAPRAAVSTLESMPSVELTTGPPQVLTGFQSPPSTPLRPPGPRRVARVTWSAVTTTM